MEPARAAARQTGMRIAAVVATAAFLVSCAAPYAQPDASSAPEYEADAAVLQEKGQTPMLCLGGITASHPPHCGDVPITNWDWRDVSGEIKHPLSTWGHYHVRGTYDGETFTLSAKPEQPQGDTRPPTESPGIPCEEPAGGWVAPDPSRATEDTMQATIERAESHPDFAGLWIGHLQEPPPEYEDPSELVLNIAFTRKLAERESDLRTAWGGSLCLVRFERSMKELEDVRDDLMEGGAEDLGLQILTIGAAGDRNTVTLEVVLVYPDTEAKLSARYGEGVVQISGRLRRVA